MEIDYIHLDTVDSTNNWVKNQTFTKATCVVARQQTRGRGRFNRSWLSPPDQNIYATVFIPSEQRLPNIGQIMSYSCVELLRSLGFDAVIKWPNDIVIHRKKIGGVLTEKTTGYIVGIGLNVNMTDDELARIDQPATSLLSLSHQPWELTPLLHSLVNHFLKNLTLLQKEGFKPFQDTYNQWLASRGEPITWHDNDHTLHGLCQGVTADGKLIIAPPSGPPIEVSTGEVV